MKKIELTQDLFATVDDADYAILNEYKWHAAERREHYYARRWQKPEEGQGSKGAYIQMHHQIVDAQPDDKVLFANGDTLDCRRENLIIKTAEQIRTEHHGEKSAEFKTKLVDPSEEYKCDKPGRKGWPVTIYFGTFATRGEAAHYHKSIIKRLNERGK